MLFRSPVAYPVAQQHHETTQIRAGEVADRSWEDATLHLQPVRPTETDPRAPR